MIKKLTSLKRFYAVMIAFCAVFSPALKAEVFNGTCGDNLSWTLNTEDSTLVITGSGGMTSNPWSNKSANIAYLSLPEGLTTIADWAFLSCSNLKAVDIPNTVSTIGSGAFSSCFSLTSIVIPESIDEIGYNVFNSCKNLSSVVIPNSVTSIGLQAFYACYALRSVELPSSIASIGIDAFGYCPTLSLVVNSWNPPTLGSNAFYPNGFSQIYVPCERLNAYMSCDGWSAYADKMLYRPMPYTVTKTPSSYGRITVVVASTVCDTTKITAIPNGGYRFVQWEDGSTDNPRYVFLTKDITVSAEFEEDKCIVGSGTCGDNLVWELSCDSVLTISGTGEMTSSPWHTYPYSASAIKLVLIGDGVTGVRSYAFDTCANLISASIPSSVVNIGEGAFAGCKKMTHFDVHGSNPNYAAFDGVLFSKDLKTLVQYPAGNKTEHYVVDSNVERILKYAFYNSSYLYSIELPPYLREIENYAFINCGHLSSVELPSSVTNIGYGVFSSCYNLRSFTFNSTTPPTMNGDIFGGRCPRVYVPCGALDAYKTAFRPIETYVGNVTDSIQYTPTQYAVIDETQGHGYVVIKNNVCEPVTITAYPYDGYRFVRWNDDVTDNPRYLTLTQDTAFAAIFAEDKCLIASGSCGLDLTWELSCDSVLTIEGSGEMTSYPWSKYTANIAYISLPEGLTSIADWAFVNCYYVHSIIIPSSVIRIGNHAFSSCTGLTNIVIPGSVDSIGSVVFSGCTAIEYAVLQEGVTRTGSSMFNGCSNLRSVTLPSTLTSISDATFYECHKLSDVTIPEGVSSIGEYAFWKCDSLKSISIPNGVEEIAQRVFWYCANLRSLNLGSGIKSIRNDAFAGCSGLDSVNVSDISVWCNIDFGNAYSNPLYYAHKLYVGGILATDITVPGGITELKNYSFAGCTPLNSVVITEGVTKIGVNAFGGCSNLSSISIPNSVTEVAGSAFSGCGNLPVIDGIRYADTYLIEAIDKNSPSYSIRSGTRWIGGSAFAGCKSLVGIVVPNSVIDIGYGAFNGCSSMSSISIGENVRKIDGSAFYGCLSLLTLDIPASVSQIGEMAFKECSSLQGISVDEDNSYFQSFDGVLYSKDTTVLYCYPAAKQASRYTVCTGARTITRDCFSGCSYFKTIRMPGTTNYLGYSALRGCSGLEALICEAVTPPNCEKDAFSESNKNAVLYVPTESIDAYRAKYPWTYFSNVRSIDSIPCQSYEFPVDSIMCGNLNGYTITWRNHILPIHHPRIDTLEFPQWNMVQYKCMAENYVLLDSFITSQGCDSVYVLSLQTLPSYYEVHFDTIYEGQSYRIYGNGGMQLVTETGVYWDTLATIWGCDSIQEWRIQVQPLPSYVISVTANSSKYGSVEGAGTYKRDTIITLAAIPNKGYQFNQWSDGNTDNPRSVTVTQDSTFTAIFGTKICSWEVESNDPEMGAVITSFNEPSYSYGTQITVEASPNSGFKFVKWNDGKKYNPYRFSLLDDKYLLAIFMAEEEEQDTTTVDPSSTTATFTWPFIVGGFSYSLTIYLDFACTIPLCTITFNQYGQLIGIVFGNRAPRRALAQDEGFTYTVSGLDADTEYFFKMETMDEENKLINTDEGSFTTSNETTGFEDIESDKIVVRKVMIDGQIYIVRGEEIFTLQGQIVK